jgi:hypothetical protein
MNMQVLDARRDASGGYRVDVSRGERVGRVSSEWFSRPADERYLSLNELARTVRESYGPQPDARGRKRAHACGSKPRGLRALGPDAARL